MFDDEKVCAALAPVFNVLYLVGLFFLVKLAQDEAIFIVACIAAAIVTVLLLRKCTKTLFDDGGFFYKIWGGVMLGLFALGTIVVVYLALAWF